MKQEVEEINTDFSKNISEIYLDPTKINKYLRKRSNFIEKDIKKRFKELDLMKTFAIYANGGFGRKEMFPIV